MKFDFSFCYRKKKLEETQNAKSNLARVLGIFDLTALGVGFTFGSGIYVLVGTVISTYSGPATLLSFLIAGFATCLSGMCYAELGARVPRSGSAYVYIYVTIGEFIGFIIGWDLILEYMIGSASSANALSQYINKLANNKISDALMRAMPMHVPNLAPYANFFAFALALVVVGLLTIGIRESTFINKIFALINTLVISFIIICGATATNSHNWNLTKEEINNASVCNHKDCGSGGFLPFGFYGLIQGAAKCFFAYIGFDAIATTGEEVKNPQRAIPISIMLTLLISTLAYFGVAIVLTMMMPYYLIGTDAAMASAFEYVHYDWAKYVVIVGATASISTCLYSGMFPMPRVTYAIASDGLIFKFLAYVAPKFKTPITATLVTGFMTATLATIFDLEELVEMTSIGTLMSYTLVSACVLILRYRPSPKSHDEVEFYDRRISRVLFFPSKRPNKETEVVTNVCTICSVLHIIILSAILTFLPDLSKPYAFVPIIIIGISLFVFVFIIYRQPQNRDIDTFKIPFVPIFPLVSVFMNVYLMMSLKPFTWLRFFIWFVIGFIIYFFYGIRNSSENKYKNMKQNICLPCCVFNEEEPKENMIPLETAPFSVSEKI